MVIGSVLPENWCAPEGGIFHRRCPKVGSGAEVILCSLRGGWFGGETQRSILRWAEQSERGLIVLGHSGGKFRCCPKAGSGAEGYFMSVARGSVQKKCRAYFVFMLCPCNRFAPEGSCKWSIYGL